MSLPDELADAKPSAKFVYYLLAREGAMSVPELLEATGLPRRTFNSGLSDLQDLELVDQETNPEDPRSHIYSLSEKGD